MRSDWPVRLSRDDALATAVVDAARRGDPAAVDAVLRHVYDRTWAIARRLMGNDADGADATQEALLAIVRGLARFDGRSSITTWCHRVATNACLDELRRRGRRPEPTDLEVLEQTGDTHHEPSESTRVEDRMAIDQALGQLSPDFRIALILRDVVGHDYAEIAEILDIPLGTVRSRLARARRQMVDLLESGNSPMIRNVETGDHG